MSQNPLLAAAREARPAPSTQEARPQRKPLLVLAPAPQAALLQPGWKVSPLPLPKAKPLKAPGR